MKKKRREFSAPERAELWRRWEQGESLSEIARALDRQPGTIHCFIAATGGIAPATRHRSARTRSLEEREDISRGLCAGVSIRVIAAKLGRSASTISREIERHGGHIRYLRPGCCYTGEGCRSAGYGRCCRRTCRRGGRYNRSRGQRESSYPFTDG